MPVQNLNSSSMSLNPDYLDLGREPIPSGTPVPMPRKLKKDSNNSDGSVLQLRSRSASLPSLSSKAVSAVTLNRGASLSSVSKAVISDVALNEQTTLLSSVQSENTNVESSLTSTIPSNPILFQAQIVSSPMNAEVVDKAFNKKPLAKVVEEYGFFRRALESIRRVFCSKNKNNDRAVEYKLGVENLKLIQAIEQRSKEAVVFFKGNDEIKEIVNLQFLARVFSDNGALLSLTKRDDGDFLFKISMPVINGNGEHDQLEKSICIKPELVGLCEHSYNHNTGQVYSSTGYLESGFFDYYYSVMASKSPKLNVNNNGSGQLEEQSGVMKPLRFDNESLLNKVESLEDEIEEVKEALTKERANLSGLVVLAKDRESGFLNKIESLKEDLENNKIDLIEANKIILNMDLAGLQDKSAGFKKLKDDFSKLNIQNGKLNSELQEQKDYVVVLKEKMTKYKELVAKNNSDHQIKYTAYVNSIASTSEKLGQTEKMFSDLKHQYDANLAKTQKYEQTIRDLNANVNALELQLAPKKGNFMTRALKK